MNNEKRAGVQTLARFSPLHSQSQCEIGVNVRWLVLESYRNGWTCRWGEGVSEGFDYPTGSSEEAYRLLSSSSSQLKFVVIVLFISFLGGEGGYIFIKPFGLVLISPAK